MKRRKKLWLASTVLTVVILLCALALINRPAPFGFLRSANSSPPSLVTILGTGPFQSFTVTEYMVEGSLEEVSAKAHEELTAQDGWVWQGKRHDIARSAIHAADQLQIAFYFDVQDYFEEPRPEEQARFVRVVVYQPATWIEKIIIRPAAVPDLEY